MGQGGQPRGRRRGDHRGQPRHVGIPSEPRQCHSPSPHTAGSHRVMNNIKGLALSKQGYRVLAASWPVYWTHEAWCHGLAQLLDQLSNNQSEPSVCQ